MFYGQWNGKTDGDEKVKINIKNRCLCILFVHIFFSKV